MDLTSTRLNENNEGQLREIEEMLRKVQEENVQLKERIRKESERSGRREQQVVFCAAFCCRISLPVQEQRLMEQEIQAGNSTIDENFDQILNVRCLSR